GSSVTGADGDSPAGAGGSVPSSVAPAADGDSCGWLACSSGLARVGATVASPPVGVGGAVSESVAWPQPATSSRPSARAGTVRLILMPRVFHFHPSPRASATLSQKDPRTAPSATLSR